MKFNRIALNREILSSWQKFCVSARTDLTSELSGNASRSILAFKAFDPPDPKGYDSAESFALDWAAYNWLRKWPDFPGSNPGMRKDNAISSWTAAEQKCLLTNTFFRDIDCGDHHDILNLPIARKTDGSALTAATVIMTARRKISMVLGEVGRRKLFSLCRWSSGATATCRRGTPLSQKMSDPISVTERALPHLRWALKRDLHWSAALVGCEPSGPMSLLETNFNVVRHNRFVVVPKSAWTDRSICAEPTGNAFLQQGVGRYIRSRLKRFGVDLDDQSWAQECAGKAHLLGLSTLDLESASDTIATELVRFLLPESWFRFLSDLRSPFTTRDGTSIKLEKFSSMGNAFTFELESLIFWALLESVESALAPEGPRKPTSVYGDDLVCSRAASGALISVLGFCGFKTNKAKSFIDGPFFESCGKHYFEGVDVTPPMLTSSVDGLQGIIRCWNRIQRFSWRLHGRLFDPLLLELVRFARPASRTGPKQPFSHDLDVGFIAGGEFKTCPNRGVRLRGLSFVPDAFPITREDASFAYKLRNPASSNAHPKGWCYYAPGSGRWVLTDRWYPQTLFTFETVKGSDFLP